MVRTVRVMLREVAQSCHWGHGHDTTCENFGEGEDDDDDEANLHDIDEDDHVDAVDVDDADHDCRSRRWWQ